MVEFNFLFSMMSLYTSTEAFGVLLLAVVVKFTWYNPNLCLEKINLDVSKRRNDTKI